MKTTLDAVMIIFPMIFTANIVMSLVKILAQESLKSTGLRIILIVFSILGVLAGSAVTGNPVDTDSVSNLATMLVEAITIAVGAHFSYKLIKQA